jgi:hypothetical protein
VTVSKFPIGSLLLILVLVAGCAKDSANGSKTSTSGGAGGASATGDGASTSGAEAPKLTLSDIPDSLKHEGFDYYGLSKDSPTSFSVTRTSQPGPEDSVLAATLESVKSDEAVFKISGTGQLSMQGDMILSLKPDGLYVLQIGENVLDSPQLELPSRLENGKSWSQAVSFKGPDDKAIEIQTHYKVAGVEKLKTALGEQSAMRLAVKMEMTDARGKSTAEGSVWLVKGIGQVKTTMKATDPSGASETMTIEVKE